MFEDVFVDGVGRTKSSSMMLLAMCGEAFLVAILVVLPMVYFDVLPNGTFKSFLTVPPPPPPPPPPPAAVVKAPKVIPRQFDAGRLMAPKVVPKQIAEIKEDEAPPPSAGGVGVVGGVPGGVAGGVTGGVLNSILESAPRAVTVLPPPPPPKKEAPKEVAPTRVRLGGNVQEGRILKRRLPVYPPLAKQARIQGVVVLKATIAKDGTVQNLTVVSGHPLLVQAAVDAAKQWVYQPVLLNGQPVELSTQINLNFALADQPPAQQ
jgi:protein TonB